MRCARVKFNARPANAQLEGSEMLFGDAGDKSSINCTLAAEA
jgi:hypothetical protein